MHLARSDFQFFTIGLKPVRLSLDLMNEYLLLNGWYSDTSPGIGREGEGGNSDPLDGCLHSLLDCIESVIEAFVVSVFYQCDNLDAFHSHFFHPFCIYFFVLLLISGFIRFTLLLFLFFFSKLLHHCMQACAFDCALLWTLLFLLELLCMLVCLMSELSVYMLVCLMSEFSVYVLFLRDKPMYVWTMANDIKMNLVF